MANSPFVKWSDRPFVKWAGGLLAEWLKKSNESMLSSDKNIETIGQLIEGGGGGGL